MGPGTAATERPTRDVEPAGRRRPRVSGLKVSGLRLSRMREIDWRAIGSHRLLLLALIPAAMLRLLVLVVYRPAFLFWQDSYEYLASSKVLTPPVNRPFGYPAVLRLLDLIGPISLVPLLQHLLGLALGVGIYAVLRRRGLGPGGATLAAVPVLYDGYQLDIEQFVLSEVMFSVLLLLAVGLPIAWRHIDARRAAVLGLVVAALVLTRTIAIPLAVVLAAYLLLRRVGWRPLVGFAAAVAVPVFAYALWFNAAHGSVGLQLMSGRLLYGKTAQFADCARLPESQRPLCPAAPVPRRLGQDFWSFTPQSPAHRFRYTPSGDRALSSFAKTVIARQPGDYAHVVAADLYHYGGPTRVSRRRDQRIVTWQFPYGTGPNLTVAIAGRPGVRLGGIKAPVTGPVPHFLRNYQRVVALPGLGLLVCLMVTLVGALRRSGPGPETGTVAGDEDEARPAAPGDGRGVRLDCLLLATVSLVLVVLPALTVALDYRFLLPDLVVLPMGAALALRGRTILPVGTPWRSPRRVRTPQAAD